MGCCWNCTDSPREVCHPATCPFNSEIYALAAQSLQIPKFQHQLALPVLGLCHPGFHTASSESFSELRVKEAKGNIISIDYVLGNVLSGAGMGIWWCRIVVSRKLPPLPETRTDGRPKSIPSPPPFPSPPLLCSIMSNMATPAHLPAFLSVAACFLREGSTFASETDEPSWPYYPDIIGNR